MSEEREIPKGWIFTNLGEVCKLKNGYAFKSIDYLKESGIPIIRISDIGEGKVDLTGCVRILEDVEYDNYVVAKNEILVAMSGATTGKFGIYKGDEKVYQNQRVGKFEILYKEVLNNSYLLYLLYSLKHQILKDAYGGAQPNISSGKIEELPFPLPPLPEQHRIVAKIEELFSSLDKGIESMKTAQEQLKVYRQAVLKWAFEGKLTNQDVKEGELPEGWKWTNFDDVSFKIGDVDHKMPKQIENGKYPYLSTKDFTDDLKLSFKNAKYISEEDFVSLSRKIQPKRGDIIFPRYGTIGKNILVETDVDFLVSYSCAVIKPKPEKVISKYLYYCSLSKLIKDEIKKYTVETTQANVGIASIKRFVLPLPPTLSEQQLIVAEIESRLSVCDKIEESISASLQQAEALRQSILKKAFEGKLVEQDPNDEPASVLLERIRAEREGLRNTQGKNKPVKRVKQSITKKL
jgi:type I restriction enzyme S subunit